MQEEQPLAELEPVKDSAEANAAQEEQPPAEVAEERREQPQAALSDDVRQALTALDNRLVTVLAAGHVRFVRSSWLLAQPEGYRIQRRQDLEALEQSGASPSPPLLSPEEAVALIRRGNRSAGILSYGCALCRWL